MSVMPRKSSMCFAYASLGAGIGIMTLVVHCYGGGWPFSTRLRIERIWFWRSWLLHLKVSALSAASVPGDLPSSHCLSAVLNSSSLKSSIGISKSLAAGGIDVSRSKGHINNILPIRLGFLRHWSVHLHCDSGLLLRCYVSLCHSVC